jgi:hypothetical protein
MDCPHMPLKGSPDRNRAPPDRDRALPDRDRAVPNRDRAAPDRDHTTPDSYHSQLSAATPPMRGQLSGLHTYDTVWQ